MDSGVGHVDAGMVVDGDDVQDDWELDTSVEETGGEGWRKSDPGCLCWEELHGQFLGCAVKKGMVRDVLGIEELWALESENNI